MQKMPSTLTGWLPEVVGCAGDGTGEPGPGAGCCAEDFSTGGRRWRTDASGSNRRGDLLGETGRIVMTHA